MGSTRHAVRLWKLLGKAVEGYFRHRASVLAAGISFRALMSVAPLLVVAQAIMSWWIGAARGRDAVLAPIGAAIGDQTEHLIAGWLDAARAYSGAATTIGVVLFLVGATRLVVAVDDTLDTVFDVPEKSIESWRTALFDWLRVEAKAFGMTVGLVLTIVVGVGLEVFLARALRGTQGVSLALAHVAKWSLGALFTTGFLALVYRVLPSIHMSRRDVIVAALVSAAALALGMVGLWLYFRVVDVGAAYGAAGAVVVVLIWLFYSAQAFVLGAEIAAASRSSRRP